MNEQELQDPVLLAVRKARPAIDDAAVSPTSADALRVLERVLGGEDAQMSPVPNATGGRRGVRGRRVPALGGISHPRLGAIALAAAAAVAVVVVVLSGGAVAPSLVDRAYAAINARDQVLHEVDIQTMASPRGYKYRVEGWRLPADGRARVVSIWGYTRTPLVSEWIITGDGRVFTRVCLGRCHPGAFIAGHSRWTSEGRVPEGTGFGLVPGNLPGMFAGWFSAAYRAHAIAPAGTATFDGKRAARFRTMVPTFGRTIVFWRPGTPPPPAARKGPVGATPYTLINWYVDPTTAQPVGFTASPCRGKAIRSCTSPAFTTRIVTFKRLDPTPENLGQLSGPNAPPGAQ